MCLSTALSVLCGLGSAQASLAALDVQVETPAMGSIARGAQRVPVLTVQLQASCDGPVKVTSMTIARKGLGTTSDIARMYVLNGLTRITRSFPLSVRGESLVLPLRNVNLAACESRLLTVAVDIAADANPASEHVFSLVRVDAGTATVNYSLADDDTTLNVGASGTPATVTAELLPVLTPPRFGGNRTIARLSVQGTAGKDQRITAITLTNNGSASNGDLQRLYWVTRTGEAISEVIPQLQGRSARIELDPGLLLEGRDTKLIELRADVRASIKRTIRWSIEEPSDIEAVEVRVR